MKTSVSGTFEVSVVDGSTYTGLYAADGSLNVIKYNGTYRGMYHPCGALLVTPCDGSSFVGFYAPDGSMNVIESTSRACGAIPVTVVSGTFNPGGGGVTPTYYIFGF